MLLYMLYGVQVYSIWDYDPNGWKWKITCSVHNVWCKQSCMLSLTIEGKKVTKCSRTDELKHRGSKLVYVLAMTFFEHLQR